MKTKASESLKPEPTIAQEDPKPSSDDELFGERVFDQDEVDGEYIHVN